MCATASIGTVEVMFRFDADSTRTTQPPRRLLRDVAVYYVLALVFAGALGWVQRYTGPEANILQLTQAGPLAAVAVVLASTGRLRAAVGRWWCSLTARDVTGALGAVVLGVAIFAVLAGVFELGGWDLHSARMLPTVLPVLLVVQCFGAVGEEIGWRGFVQPRLEQRWSVVGSAVVVGVLWGLWHPQTIGESPGIAVAFLVSTVAISVIMGVVTDCFGLDRVLFASAFHGTVNTALMMVLNEEEGSVTAMMAVALAMTLGAAAVILVPRRAVEVSR